MIGKWFNGIYQPVKTLCHHSNVIISTTVVCAATATLVYPLAHIGCMETDDAEYGREWFKQCVFPWVQQIFFSDFNFPSCDYSVIEFAYKTDVFDHLPYVSLFGAGFGFFSSIVAIHHEQSASDDVYRKKNKP